MKLCKKTLSLLLTLAMLLGMIPAATLVSAEEAAISSWMELQQDIDATATASGGTLTLTRDYTALSVDGPLVIPEDKTLTLNLNGHTVDRSLANSEEAVKNGEVIDVIGTLILKDSSQEQTGKITGGYGKEGGGIHVDDDHDPVYRAAGEGITAGTIDTTFSPTSACTRAQIVTFLWRAAGSPEPAGTETPFTDVQNPDAWYYKPILWAYENGVTSGVSVDAFGVKQVCTRAQVVTFLWRMADSPEPELSESPFNDVQNPDAWYYSAVLWAAENDITAGTSAGRFSPAKTCARAEVVTFLYSCCTGTASEE